MQGKRSRRNCIIVYRISDSNSSLGSHRSRKKKKKEIDDKRTYIHNITRIFYVPIHGKSMDKKDKSPYCPDYKSATLKSSRTTSSAKRTNHTAIICENQPLTSHRERYECTKFEQQRRKDGIESSTASTSKKRLRNTIRFVKDSELYDRIWIEIGKSGCVGKRE